MAVNWGLLNGNNALSMFQFGAQLGQDARERREQRETKNALAAYAADPSEKNLAPVLAADPRLGVQLRGQMQKQQADAQKQQQDAIPTVLNMLKAAKANPQAYPQIVAQARQMGIPGVENAPAEFDPAWADQQIMTLEAFATPQGREALSTAGKQAVDMGYQPGTPEFNQAVQQIWTASQAKPYVVGGETRLYTPKIGGTGQVLGADLPAGFTLDQGGPTQPASGTFPTGQ